jgi:hypothetical protein
MMLSLTQSSALMSAACAMGEENSFPVFFGRGIYREPYGWRHANARALYLKRASTFKSLLERGWLDRVGDKTFGIKYGEPGSEEYGDLTLNLKVYRLTDLGIAMARSEMERGCYDFDLSVAAGTWVLKEPAQNPS